MMSKRISSAVIAIMFMCAAVGAYAAEGCGHCANCAKQGSDLGAKTAGAVTGTARSAASGTVVVAETAVTNTAAAPLTAVQAVKDTANTAFSTTDAAIKAFTGEDS